MKGFKGSDTCQVIWTGDYVALNMSSLACVVCLEQMQSREISNKRSSGPWESEKLPTNKVKYQKVIPAFGKSEL